MTEPFDWEEELHPLGLDGAERAYLRTRIEAEFVPVERYEQRGKAFLEATNLANQQAARAEAAEARVAELTAHTKALIEGAGEVAADLITTYCNDWDGSPLPDIEETRITITAGVIRQAAATIAALRAENERAKAVDTGIGIEPHEQAVGWHLPTMLRWIDENRTATTMPSGELVGTVLRTAAARIERFNDRHIRAKEEGVRAGIEAALKAHRTAQYDPAPYSKGQQAIKALDAAAIAKGITTAVALSDLIAGDAHLIDAPSISTLADSDGDDGA